MGRILRFVQEVKDDLSKKKELENKRSAMIKRMNDGLEFFKREGISASHGVNTREQTRHLESAATQFSGVIEILLGLEADIREIDFSVVMKLESFFSDFVIKFEMPVRTDQAGDKVAKEIAVLVPCYTDDSQYTEITPEDLKLVLFLKDKFQIRNFNAIEPISKEVYYQENNLLNGGLQS
jgi:hypothetical protein